MYYVDSKKGFGVNPISFQEFHSKKEAVKAANDVIRGSFYPLYKFVLYYVIIGTLIILLLGFFFIVGKFIYGGLMGLSISFLSSRSALAISVFSVAAIFTPSKKLDKLIRSTNDVVDRFIFGE